MEDCLRLQKLNLYVKKSINTKLKVDTLKSKLKLANDLFDSISNQIELNEEEFPKNELDDILADAAKWHKEIVQILKVKLGFCLKSKSNKQSSLPYSFKVARIKTNNMPDPENAAFDIKQATAIVQPYDGSAENLDAFVDAVTLLKDYVQQAHLNTAIKFLKTRLLGKARIGLSANIATIDALIADVKLRCQDKQTPEGIIAKIKNVKQRTDTNSLCDEIDSLTLKLKSIYIQQGIPDNIAQAMSTKTGVDALINNVNHDTKIILKAGNFSNIKDAVQKVQENASQNPTQILSMQRQNNYSRDGRGNRPFRGNSISHRGGYSHRGKYQSHNNYRGRNFQRPSNYYPNRQGQNGNFRGRRDPSRRIYAMQSENSMQGVQPPCPSIPMQFQQAVIPAQPHHFINYPQPNFLAQGQRGQPPSSQ